MSQLIREPVEKSGCRCERHQDGQERLLAHEQRSLTGSPRQHGRVPVTQQGGRLPNIGCGRGAEALEQPARCSDDDHAVHSVAPVRDQSYGGMAPPPSPREVRVETYRRQTLVRASHPVEFRRALIRQQRRRDLSGGAACRPRRTFPDPACHEHSDAGLPGGRSVDPRRYPPAGTTHPLYRSGPERVGHELLQDVKVLLVATGGLPATALPRPSTAVGAVLVPPAITRPRVASARTAQQVCLTGNLAHRAEFV